ncbi:MAG: hypothetical protein F2814_03755 [Actinobacteria bacterium]|nr:hypothetical protein [Actinomycetota bacterium]
MMFMAGASANSLIATSPLADSTVSSSPSAVTISTEAPLIDMGNSIVVTDPRGLRVDDGTLAIDGANAVVGLKPLTVGGAYTVTYTLLTENDIPLEGSFIFNFSAPTVITTPSATPVITTSQTPTPGKTNNGSWGTSAFVIGMLVLAFAVLIGLSLYARKIFKGR